MRALVSFVLFVSCMHLVHAEEMTADLPYQSLLLVRRSEPSVSTASPSFVRRSSVLSSKRSLQDKIKQILGTSVSKEIKDVWQESRPSVSVSNTGRSVRRSRSLRPLPAETIYKINVSSQEEADILIEGFATDEDYYVEPDYVFKATWAGSRPPEEILEPEVPVQEGPEEIERTTLDDFLDYMREWLLSSPEEPELTPAPIPEPQPEPEPTPTPISKPQPEPKPAPEPFPAPQPEPEPERIPIPLPEPVVVVDPLVTNDRHVSEQWAVEGIDLPEAWALQKESDQDVIVAVIDTGFDIHHPDLIENVWVNSREIPDNGIDDDGNGFVDDVNGWDFAHQDGDVFNHSDRNHGSYFHGTHVAGIVGARTNNGMGMASVSYYNKVKVMLLKVFADGEETAPTSHILSAIDYAMQQGANVINFSLGGMGYSYTYDIKVSEAVQRGLVLVASAGNEGSALVNYPAGFVDTISVASSTEQDTRSETSSYGRTVDVSAPGEGIFSLFPEESMAYATGTSMASPLVAGLAATLMSQRSDLTPAEIRQVLTAAVDPMMTSSARPVGSGRINAMKAMQRIQNSAPGLVEGREESVSGMPVLRMYIQKQSHLAWYKVYDESSNHERIITADIVADSYEMNIYRAGRGGIPLWSQRVDRPVNGARIKLMDIADTLSSLAYAGKFRLEVIAYRNGHRLALNQIVWYNVGMHRDRLLEEEVLVGESFAQEDVLVAEESGLRSSPEPRVMRRRHRGRSLVVR